MSYLEICCDNMESVDMIDYKNLVITLNGPIKTMKDEKDKLYKISFDVIDNYVYLPKENKIVISFHKDIHEDNSVAVPCGMKPKEIGRRKMSDYDKYLKDGNIIRYVYKKEIYYGIYNKNKRLINNKYRSLSGFVSDVSGGKYKNGWKKCEKLEEKGIWMSVDSNN